MAKLFREMGFYPPEPDRAPIAPSVLDFLGAGNPLDLPRDVLVHGNFLSDAEVRDLANEGRSGLIISPGTRKFHGVRTRILDRAKRWGLPIALGTDSLASNTELNLWAEMRLLLRTPSNQTATGWSTLDAFELATVGGAQVLGMEDQIGQLLPGYKADFVAMELGKATNSPLDPRSLMSKWITQKQTPRISGVWVEGEDILQRPLYLRH